MKRQDLLEDMWCRPAVISRAVLQPCEQTMELLVLTVLVEVDVAASSVVVECSIDVSVIVFCLAL